MDFTAIDFETANERRDSACALGVVTVEGGEIVEERAMLIRPPELRFNRFNVCIHGIRPEHVAHEPEFDGLWQELRPYLEGRLVLAHNARFDMGVLSASLDLYSMEYPDLRYSCTMRLARKVWPSLRRHRLDTVAGHLGIEFKHHDALEDARACSLIALHAAAELGASSFDDLAGRLGLGVQSLIALPV
ncbi:MAG: exonuclease [Actinobacteria bacterium]|nr:MAG: exonuclease [Actinomycetota bacterium]